MERTRSCSHDVTTSTFWEPADGRQRQSIGNGGVRDWMCLCPECQHQGWARVWGQLSPGQQGMLGGETP